MTDPVPLPWPYFTCELCGQTFLANRPNADALAEAQARYGDVPTEDMAMICDECFHTYFGEALRYDN